MFFGRRSRFLAAYKLPGSESTEDVRVSESQRAQTAIRRLRTSPYYYAYEEQKERGLQ